MAAPPRLERIADAVERLATAAERIAAALEGDAELQGILAEALGGPAASGPIDPAALDWRNMPGGVVGFTVADGAGGRRIATPDEQRAIESSIEPKAAGRRR